MQWNEVAKVLGGEQLLGITVAGGVTVGDEVSVFYPDFNRIYLEFDSCFVEFKRLSDIGDGFRLKISLTEVITYEMVQDGDELSNASASITNTVLPEAWDYKVVAMEVFSNSEAEFDKRIINYVALEIAHGHKVMPDLFSTTTLFVHPYSLFDVGLETDNQQTDWHKKLFHNSEGRYIFRKSL